MRKALILSQLIANAHRDSVRLLFDRYGITDEPSGPSILKAYLRFGTPFLKELYGIIKPTVEVNFTGTEKVELEYDKLNAYSANKTAEAEEMSKGGFFDSMLNIFSKTGDFLNAASGTYAGVENLLKNVGVIDTGVTGQQETETELQRQLMAAELERQNEESASKTKTILLILAGALVVGLIVFMVLKKRR